MSAARPGDRTHPRWIAAVLASLVAIGCNGPSSRDDRVVADAGAPSDCGGDGSGPTSSGVCSGSGSGSGSGEPALDPQACADCLIGHVAIVQSCGDVAPDLLEAAATACGAPSYAALGSGSLVCARSLAWATVHGAGLVGNALGVDGPCRPGADAAGAACLGAIEIAVAAGGYAQSLIDALRDCPATIGPTCVLARDFRDSLRIAAAAIGGFRGALPPDVATRDLVDWLSTAALGPLADGLLRDRFAQASVGAALDGVAGDLQGRADALSGSIDASCF